MKAREFWDIARDGHRYTLVRRHAKTGQMGVVTGIVYMTQRADLSNTLFWLEDITGPGVVDHTQERIYFSKVEAVY